jgi:hypothetical protein
VELKTRPKFCPVSLSRGRLKVLPELAQVAYSGVSLEAHEGGAVDRGHHRDLGPLLQNFFP